MIENTAYKRAYWFGASDASKITSKNTATSTYKEWWDIKCGRLESNFGNIYTEAGTLFEHPILRALDENIRLDLELRNPDLCLRVHYDGDHNGVIEECKTFKASKVFEVSKAYWQQAQVEMYMYQEFYTGFRGLNIVAYPMTGDDYKLYFEDQVEINPNKIQKHPVKYDKYFIQKEIIPTLKMLSKKLKKEVGKDSGIWELSEW